MQNDPVLTLQHVVTWVLISIVGFIFKIILLIYFWLCWVLIVAHGLSLVAESGDYSLVAEHRL